MLLCILCFLKNLKNRVWTLLLQVYIRQSVIVSVNYIISYRQCLLWHQKICKVAIRDDEQRNLLYLSNLIDATTCRYTCMNVSRLYFSTKPQGPSEKFGVCGWAYIACSCTHERPIYKAASSAVPKQRSVAIWYPLWKEAVVLKTTNWLCKDSQPAGSLTMFDHTWILLLPFNNYISICSSIQSTFPFKEGQNCTDWKLCTWIWLYGQASMHVTKFWK